MTTKEERELRVYRRAINRIDDYFEYRNESDKDKAYVMSVIDELTNELATFMKSSPRT